MFMQLNDMQLRVIVTEVFSLLNVIVLTFVVWRVSVSVCWGLGAGCREVGV